MTKKLLSLCALCVGGAVLLGQTTEAQVLPRQKAKDKPVPKATDTPAPKPKEAAKPGDTPRVTKKPVTPDDAKDARDDLKDRAKDKRDDAKDTGDKVKDRTKDARDDVKDRAKDTAKDARDDVKDRAKDTAKDARDDAKDRAKDAKDVAKDAKQARKFDAEKVKVDDLGLSFKEADDGIAISNVTKNSVFVDAGFRSGDQIVSINGRDIRRQNDFVTYLFAPDVVRVGRVPVIVMRGGARETIYVQPATIIRNYETVVYSGRRNPVRDFGLVVDGRNDDHVYVERVIKDSRADQAGIQVDDEILAVNEQQVETSKDLAQLLEKFEAERIDMEVRRDREAKVIEVKVIR
ncbi:MAG: PDZ domain-containing protein [Planctomycetaceae bacterium]|nr:PDZ domain-containing protein [Planctomycetaceae bacterium]